LAKERYTPIVIHTNLAAVKLRRFIRLLIRVIFPFFDPSVSQWAIQARLLHWLTFTWLFVGLVILFSASYPVGDALGDGLYYFKRQLFWAVLGFVGFYYVVHYPLRYFLRLSPWFVFGLLALILLTLTGLGTTTNGSTRWLALGSMPIQPSELIKPFLVLQSAQIFGRWQRIPWRTRFFWLFVFALVLLGILLQPNLSMTALCGMTLWLMALAAGIPYLYLLPTAIGGIILAVVSINTKDYQKRRILSFLNPWGDPMGISYQLVQSLLAVGSGGIWGTGFGLSQQKLFYLPIQYTDFIFAVFAEEFGFVGSLLLLLLLLIYATLALLVAFNTRNPIHRLVAIGAMILMVGQSLLNIGVATGVLPTTGLPLPLISYGGNSMITSLFVAGLLIRVARESNEAEVVPLQERSLGKKQGNLA
jgi:cell division protein FtsW